ncbi:MAG: 50S ribosomal protein L17 [Patescibacteria group bacterium]|nr:50S ribosomal protein L17 [Patescibacteria group bacterium]
MRKRIQITKFGRQAAPRKALLSSIARALFIKGKITTTEAKAKAISSLAERIITKSRKGDLTATRFLSTYFDKPTVKKIIEEIVPKYKERAGGYTRVIKLGPRKSDGARMAVIEFIE